MWRIQGESKFEIRALTDWVEGAWNTASEKVKKTDEKMFWRIGEKTESRVIDTVIDT